MASLLSASILLSPLQGLAQTREASAPRAGLTTASGGALERMLGDTGGFDRVGVQAPVGPLPTAPRILSVREVARRGPGEPNGWEGFARDASARREATLASLLSAVASLAPRAERGGSPSEREAVQALKQAAKAQTWLWAGRALSPKAPEGDGAASVALIAFLASGEPEATAWVKSVSGAPMTARRREAARSALPALAKAWRLPHAGAIPALVARALSRAQALRPAAPKPEAQPPAQARPKPAVPPSPALGDADPSRGAGAPAGSVAQAAGTPVAQAGNVASALTLDKLGQRSDLAGTGRGSELEALERVLQDNAALTGRGRPAGQAGPERGAPGAVESSEYRWANLEALKRALLAPAAEEAAPEAAAKPPLAGTPQEKAIEALVQRVETASGDAQAQLGARDAAAGMLAAADRARGSALRERRTAREMQDFRKNYSRLAMVMELSYTLNLLTSAEAAAKGMQAIMERKLGDIQAARRRSEEAAREAAERAQDKDKWAAEKEKNVQEDIKNMDLFEGLKTIAAKAVERVQGFRNEVSAAIEAIEARDRGQSPDAASEYRRRLALIPLLGNSPSGDLSDLSVPDLKKQLGEVKSYLADISAGEGQFDAVPQEMRALAIYKVPGVPAFNVTNADAAQTLAMLAQRRTYWEHERDELRKKADSARARVDPGNTRRTLNDFGDPVPESLQVWRNEASEKLSRAKSGARRYAGLMDAANGRMGAGLPMLSGLDYEGLHQALLGYADALDRWTPPAGANALDALVANLDKLDIARYLPQLADHVIAWAENEETIKVLDEYLAWLPGVASRLGQAPVALQRVIDDVGADEAWVNGGMNLAEGDVILARKKALIAGLKSMLLDLQDLLERVLIPQAEKLAGSGAPGAGADGYKQLYDAKLELITKTREAYDKSVPWKIASWGAPGDNAAAALANIAEQRRTFQEYRQRITDFNDEVKKRTDPAGTLTEDLYGEQVPYSLPVRIKQFQEEQGRRAAQVNAAASTINEILRQIDQATAGRYALASRYTLPTGIAAGDPGSKNTLEALSKTTKIQDLGAALKKVAEDGQAAAGTGGLGDVAGGGTTVPTGNQPDVKLPEGQRIALLALEAIKRLLPTSATSGGSSFAEGLARYLFSDAVIDGSQKALAEQIPRFKPFLARADVLLDRVFADLSADEAYVSSGGGNGAAVYARKIHLFGDVAAVAREGMELFEQKKGWDKEGAGQAEEAADYYGQVGDIYNNSLEAIKAEEEAALTYKASIDAMAAQWTKQKEQVAGWLKQLNDPHETAMNRIAQNLSALQEKTRAVLESNGNYQRLKRELEAAQSQLEEKLRDVESGRKALARAIADVRTEDLDPRLSDRIDKLTLGGPAWLSASPRGPQTLVIPKGNMASFLNTLLGTFGSDTSSRDIAQLREQLLRNPNALAQLLPNAQMLSLGDDPNGFYLVYQSNFAVPGGLETESTVTLGNLGHVGLGDTNISAIGYRFASPPSDGNAPYGDQGVTIRAESLGGEHAVNYLDVTFHRLLQDLPKDLAPQSQAQEARMMLFDDFAFMAAGGKLYFGAVGFADMAVHDRANKPWYAGGNVKTEIQFQEVMTLTAEQSQLYASDPRSFMQKVNLDFTKFDPTLNQDFVISAKGEQKEFLKRKLGTRFDIGKAVGSQQAFTLEVYGSQLRGTDDISQNAAGATLVKGFAFNLGDNTPARVTGTLNGELGEKYNSGTARVSFELPKQGIVLSAQGKMLGDADSYLLELRKRMGDNAEAFISYGSPYVGLNNRLTIGTQTSFTLGQLWRAAVGGAAQDAVGGAALKGFHDNLDKFFEREAPDGMLLGELKRVFDSDIGKRLIELEIGSLSRELGELAKAGAIMDNTRMRGMIGFVSGPIGLGTADRAAGGGFQIGTQTDMTLSKTKRALVEQRMVSVYQHGLKLQTRLLELAKDWQQAVSDVVQAQWELALALWSHTASNDPVLRAATRARAVEADGRLRQARLRYNLLTGRSPDDATLEAVNPRDFDQLLREIGSLLDQSDRITRILRALDPAQLPVPEPGFNLLDWIPVIEGITLSIGAQLQDLLANQVLGMGVTIRIPVYDPTSKRQDKAMLLESTAILDEMRASYLQYRARAQAETLQAQGLEARIKLLEPESLETAKALGRGLRDHRNGLLRREGLWDAERRWRESLNALLEARARVGLAKAWAMMDQEEADSGRRLAIPAQGAGQATDLFGAVKEASAVSPSMDALAYRSQAAAQLLEASDRRFAKWGVDLFIGTNITADGIGWIPAFGLTGIGIFPIINTQLRPDELQSLERRRRGAEEQGAGWLAISLESDLAMQIVTQASAYRAAADALAVAETELIPLRERQAASGGPNETHALTEAKLEAEALRTARDQAQASMNFLLGRPAGAPLELAKDPQALMAQLRELYSAQPPLEARRRVLEMRVETARAVETIVDKNLKVQEIRVEPVSLIGRSLGRLIAALSGSGDSSPELVARARNQTLEAERELAALERGLGAARSRLSFQLAFLDAELRSLEGKTDPESRMRMAALRNRRVALQVQAAALGVDLSSPDAAASPASWDQLKDRLVAAVEAKVSPEGLAGVGDSDFGNEPQAQFMRWYGRMFNAFQSLGKEHIGKWFKETWIELRLRSLNTSPEGLVALAQLEEQKGDELQRAATARARAEAEMLLARFASRANLLRWTGAYGGTEATRSGGQAVTPSREYVEALETGLRQDFAVIAAHLGLAGTVRVQDIVALVPRESASDPERSAERTRAEMDDIDFKALKRILFEDGVPDAVASMRDGVLQLKADLIAEKMSYKGFTPVGAFGIFRDTKVGGVFLEAPDPRAIEKGLREVLTDALRQELESQDRLRTLGLKLHSLMASVADNTKLLTERLATLRAARDNWAGTQIEAARGLAPRAAIARAQAEADRAEADFLDTLLALRLEFVELATELAALGHRSIPSTPRAPVQRPSGLPGAAAGARERLLDYWTDRMLDTGFEAELARVFDGRVATEDREALRKELELWRTLKSSAETLRASELDPKERLDLLGRADVAGRRGAVRRRLERLLGSLGGFPGAAPAEGAKPTGGDALWKLLLADIDGQLGRARTGLDADRSLVREMREAFWRSGTATETAQGHFERLTALKVEAEERRDALLAAYLEARERPEDFLLRDRRLDAYLGALQAFDAGVVNSFSDVRISGDRLQALRLNAVFSLSESAARRRDYLRHGRALLAADILVEAESARLDALRFERGPVDSIGAVSQRIAWLKAFRDRLVSRPDTLPSLAAGVDGSGQAQAWWTLGELSGLERAGRVIVSEGVKWILPAAMARTSLSGAEALVKAGALRLVTGVDAAQEQLQQGREAQKQGELDRRAQGLLAQADFALIHHDGTVTSLSLAELRALEAKGRVLYFDSRPDRRGLRPALHPVAARMMDPKNVLVLVDRQDRLSAGRFPTLESLSASGEKDQFSLLRAGARGARALAAEETRRRDATLSGAWILLKLDGYAFALDEDGGIQGVYMNEKELDAAREKARSAKDDDPMKKWSFHRTKDLSLGLAEDGTLVEARLYGKPVFRREGLRADRWIKDNLFGAQLDHEGRLVRAYTDRGDMEREARGWWLEDMEGNLWPGDGSVMSPAARLRRYVACEADAQRQPRRETCVPIVLGRAFLERYLDAAQDGKKSAERWWYMPYNWPNIALETPRGIVKMPIEMITGRDPNQSGYIGGVYMRRGEGGATDHRGPLGKVVQFFDFLEILPDPVDRYHDPSQFPKTAEGDGAAKPGRQPFEGTPEAGGKDLHLGAQGWMRRIRYAQEDIEEARGRILGAFEGGVRSQFVETVRGRAGTYPEAKVEHSSGRLAMDQALRELGFLADASGDASLSVDPGHLAVDHVEGDVQIRLGAAQHEAARKRYEAWTEELEKAAAEPQPEPDLAGLDRDLRSARVDRMLSRAAEAAAPEAGKAFKATAFPLAPLLTRRPTR